MSNYFISFHPSLIFCTYLVSDSPVIPVSTDTWKLPLQLKTSSDSVLLKFCVISQRFFRAFLQLLGMCQNIYTQHNTCPPIMLGRHDLFLLATLLQFMLKWDSSFSTDDSKFEWVNFSYFFYVHKFKIDIRSVWGCCSERPMIETVFPQSTGHLLRTSWKSLIPLS